MWFIVKSQSNLTGSVNIIMQINYLPIFNKLFMFHDEWAIMMIKTLGPVQVPAGFMTSKSQYLFPMG